MKKLICKALIFTGLCAGIPLAIINSACAQTRGAANTSAGFTNRLVLPLTNGLGFTNTLVPATNLSNLQLSNVVTLLLSLQTNIEEVLPVVTTLTSNAAFEVPTNAAGVPQTVIPFTANPTGLPPTGQASGVVTQQPVISMPLGRTTVEIDPATFQGLVILRNNLEQALPVLQLLNGTAPTNSASPTNAVLSPTGGTNPFGPPFMPLTNVFTAPMTNQSHMLTIPSPF